MQSNGLIKQVMSLSSLKVWIRSPLLSSTTTAYYYNVTNRLHVFNKIQTLNNEFCNNRLNHIRLMSSKTSSTTTSLDDINNNSEETVSLTTNDGRELMASTKSKFKEYRDDDTEVIYDVSEESFIDDIRNNNKNDSSEVTVPEFEAELQQQQNELYLFRQKPKKLKKVEPNLQRGVNGVFDIHDLVQLLRNENMTEIAVIEVPEELNYCQYMVLSNAKSKRHLNAFIEYFNKVYKMKKHPTDPFVDFGGKPSDDWKVVDMKNIVMHLFMKSTRDNYDIETLWTVGHEFDDKIQRPAKDDVKDIMQKHMKFLQEIRPKKVFLFVVIICQLSVDICGETSDDNAKPNFVILIADDLGIGDVSSFGNTSLNTANIDRIGNEGALLTHHLTAASVCTPSRSAFLTGRYPIRTGMASAARNRVFLFVAAKGGLPTNETTFAKTLQQNNYGTALIGKWHLGNDCDALGDACHHPLNHGFDHFYGLPLTNLKDFGNDGASVVKSYFPQFTALLATIAAIGLTLAFITFAKKYHKLSLLIIIFLIIVPMLALVVQKSIKTINSVLMRGTQVIEQPIQLEGITDRLVNEAQEFIVNQTVENKPFLVVLNFVKVHSAHFPSNPFKGKSGYGKYGDCVLEMDSGVGRILDFLKNNNLRDNTFVYFSSDNGGHLEEVGIDGEKEGGYNGLFKGGKGHGAMEGGIRVPTAIMWPNKIPAKTVISVPTSQMDIYTTIHKITNIPVPSDRIIDGKNILSLLLQPKTATDASQHKFLFHYCGTYLHGVRYMEDRDHIWKLYFYRPKFRSTGEYKCQFMCMCFEPHVVLYDPPLVFNLANDPYEDYPLDVLSNERHSLIVKEIARAIEAHDHTVDRVPSQFDFWQSVWRPWLQPCCQLPNCRCSEPVRTQQHKIMKK